MNNISVRYFRPLTPAQFLLAAVIITIIFFSILVSIPVSAQTDPGTIPLDSKPPIDPKILVGKLDNGLTYYIRENQRPEKRAELRLLVNVGSIEEDDDQQGLAHFVEHMAFNGSKHFEKQELIDFMELIGMPFGAGVNASTGFDQTTYMLRVPTDTAGVMENAFQIMEDWAHGLSFDHEEIDKERGVIIEEWREGRGASARMFDKQFPVLFKDSKYAERLPIGKPEILENFEYDTLKRFYRDWYRPDLMAVVAVGDFVKEDIEKLVIQFFSGLTVMDDPRPRQLYDIPDNNDPLIAIASDHEATSTSVSVYFKKPVTDQSTIGAYRLGLVQQIYDSMVNSRLSELVQKADPPFIFGGSGQGSFIQSKEVYILQAAVQDGGVEQGLEALLTEAERVARYGFTGSELDRKKRDLLRGFEQAYAEREKRYSASYASEFIRNYTTGEPIPGIEYEYELAKRFIPGITLDDVNRLSRELITNENRVILVNSPEKEGLVIPAEADLLAIFEKVKASEITPYEDTLGDQPLIAETPNAGTIVEEKFFEDVQVTEWRLSNGVTVVLRPTDFQKDQVVMRAFSPGGTSMVQDEEYLSASMATTAVALGGAGGFSATDLQKVLSGKVVQVMPSISSLSEGVSGSASPKDIETLFQLTYLYFTEPRSDAESFQSMITRLRGLLSNRSASPEVAFQDTLTATLYQYHYRARPLTEELLAEIDRQEAIDFYRDRFADASDFTFVFVGNIEPETVKPHVLTYLGGLPSINRVETWRDTGMEYPEGVVKKTVYRGIEQKSRTQIVFTGEMDYSRAERHKLRSLSETLDIVLREVVREELGGTYGVTVSHSTSDIPDEEYSLVIGFSTDPERLEELSGVVFREIEKLKTDGTTPENVLKVQETQRRSYETNLRQNNYWLSQISFRYRQKSGLSDILTYEETINSLTAAMIQEAANRYLDTGNYVQVSLLPEKKD